MKPRRVIVEIEMDTAISIAHLKDFYKAEDWLDGEKVKIHQVQVNVMQKTRRMTRVKK
jgi:hypothetical protein